MENYVQLISTLGFPIVACISMALYVKEQTKNKEPHMCLLINKVLRHGIQSQYHYRVIPHMECPLNKHNDY